MVLRQIHLEVDVAAKMREEELVFLVQLITQPRLKQFFLTIIDLNRLHDFLLLNFTEFICRKTNGDTPISGKSMVGESVVEASRKWVGEVFQDGLFSHPFFSLCLDLAVQYFAKYLPRNP